MSETCARCQKSVYAAETPMRMPGAVYHNCCFKCKHCNVQLSLKTYHSKANHVWCKTHVPVDVPDQGVDATVRTQIDAPKGLFYGRSFTEKSAGQGSQYGPGSVALETAKAAPKPVVPVNQANKLEVLHYPVERFSSTSN